MKNALKACPFCAAQRDEAKPVADSPTGPYLAEADVIYCGSCGIMFVGTVEQWNTRASGSQEVAEELDEALEEIARLTAGMWARPDVVRASSIDILTRKDGKEQRYEGDWIKLLIHVLPDLRKALPSPPGEGESATGSKGEQP